jgi:hypothetical protein
MWKGVDLMRNPKLALCLLCCLTLLASTAVLAKPGDLRAQPRQFLPATDGPLVQLSNPVDGRIWSIWSYRNGAEFDLAISSNSAGIESELQLVGLGDGLSQSQPALTVDAVGNVYLTYIERLGRRENRLVVSSLRYNRSTWSVPTALTEATPGIATPALEVIGDKLIVAFRSADGVDILQLPLLPQVILGNFTDGPDPISDKWPIVSPPALDGDDTQDGIIGDPVHNTLFGPGSQSGGGDSSPGG